MYTRELASLLEASFGFDIDAIWYNVCGRYENEPYSKRIDIFCDAVRKGLIEKRLKIVDSGAFLEGSPDELVFLFRKNFPEKECFINKALFSLDCNNNTWAPGGAVWITPNGKEIWT